VRHTTSLTVSIRKASYDPCPVKWVLQSSRATGGGTPQDTHAGGIVDVEVFIGRSGIPTDEVIEQVVDEDRGGGAVGATGDVAPTVVTAGVDLAGFIGTGGAAVSQSR
jgi:hypothetical protein